MYLRLLHRQLLLVQDLLQEGQGALLLARQVHSEFARHVVVEVVLRVEALLQLDLQDTPLLLVQVLWYRLM